MKITLDVEYKDMDKVVLTNEHGDTYTSKSEELMDFLHKILKTKLYENTNNPINTFYTFFIGTNTSLRDGITAQYLSNLKDSGY